MTNPKPTRTVVTQRLTYSIPKAADMLGLSISTLYRYKDLGLLEMRKRGNRTFVTLDELQQFIDDSPVVEPKIGSEGERQ